MSPSLLSLSAEKFAIRLVVICRAEDRLNAGMRAWEGERAVLEGKIDAANRCTSLHPEQTLHQASSTLNQKPGSHLEQRSRFDSSDMK